MYHDEFARRPVRQETSGEVALPGVALEVGAGLWMALMASWNQTVSAVLFQLGGMVPLVACSGSMVLGRCREALIRLSGTGRGVVRAPLPVPHLSLASSAATAGRRVHARSNSARAGFDRSGRLG